MIHQITDTEMLCALDDLAFKPLKSIFSSNSNLSLTTHINIVQPLGTFQRIHQGLQERNLKWMLE